MMSLRNEFVLCAFLCLIAVWYVIEKPMCKATEVAMLEKLVRLENELKLALKKVDETITNIQKPSLSITSPIAYFAEPLRVSQLEINGWKMIFRATAGNGDSVYEAWNSGKGTSNQKPIMMDRSVSSHFRDPGIDNWSNHGIKFVKLALYEERRESAYVIFNAEGTDKDNWFSSSKVVDSSWSDLTSSSTYNYFSIAGHASVHRRFMINKQYNECPNDQGHMIVKDAQVKACPWEDQPTYPQFIYSKINTVDIYDKLLYGRADHLAIFVFI